MKGWDLFGPSAKLEMSLKSLMATSEEVNRSWDDKANRQFVEKYLMPLEPRIKLVRDAVRRLAEVLEKAERECRTE